MREVLGGRKLILAPLVGGSDLTYRLLCRKYGAQVTFTEMCQAVYFNNRDTVSRSGGGVTFEFDASDRPLGLQIAASVEEVDEAIKMANHPMFAGHVDWVDLNCGCPQGFAMKRGIGSAMFRKPDELVEMVRKMSKSIPYPLSVKCRLHEDGVDATISLLNRIIEAGATAVTVHGRFWWQKGEKRGVTDREAIKKVRDGLPKEVVFIANGDIAVYEDFESLMQATGACAGMSGYGALLNPGAVFCARKEDRPSVATMISDYLTLAVQHHNKLVDVQRHLAWLLKPVVPRGDKSIKEALFQQRTLPDTLEVIKSRLNLSLDFVEPLNSRIDGPIKTSDIVDPKQRKRAEKRERRVARKMAEKKRVREEKSKKAAAETNGNNNNNNNNNEQEEASDDVDEDVSRVRQKME